MQALARLGLAMALWLSAFVAPASADWPAIVARDDGVELRGLPAISGDGRTLAFVSMPEFHSDAERIAVELIDVRTGQATGEWLVQERDDAGNLVPLPDDGRGTTPWRRARNITLQFAAGGFRALTELTAPADATETGRIEGAGLRMVHASPESDVVMTDATGRERLRMRLPLMRSFCGMSDDAPTQAPPTLLGALVDPHTRTIVLTYGHVYASCMCDSDVAREVRHYRR